ncbi:helix-turn-helix domain-containing protein [Apilactobacillus timberlakei]|uniref:helix-turn-helix domain-containing protein n=2 Tax=Apilactobacillus timberlakei TaxID=2008380 RepID=UPI001CDD8787|nr:helix-turn-helix transcriptional regulator [Apilactobacillus timberlakei]
MIYVNNLKKESVQMRFGERLKTARNKKELTQDNVAVIFKVSRKTISSWENENSYPDINSLIQISNFYHISLDTLLKEDVGMKEFLDKKDVKVGLRPIQIGLNILGCAVLFAYLLIFFENALNINLWVQLLLLLVFIIICASFVYVQRKFVTLEKRLDLYSSTWFEKIFTNLWALIVTEVILTIVLITSAIIFLFTQYDTTPLNEFTFVLIIAILNIYYHIKKTKNKATTKK